MRNLAELVASRPLRRAAGRVLSVLACATVPWSMACGKKGPPLVPLVRLPVAPPQAAASRAGDVVTIRFTVPNANVSGVRPADLERIDVYAWTGPAVPPTRVFKVAKVVASVPVRTPPPPQEPDEAGKTPPPPPPVGPGVDQGGAAQLQETLASDAFVAIESVPPKKVRTSAPEPKLAPPDVMSAPVPLTRHYLVVGVNHGDKRGPAAAELVVGLWPAPPAPPVLTARSTETGTVLAWTAPADLPQPVQQNVVPPAPAAAPAATSSAARAGLTTAEAAPPTPGASPDAESPKPTAPSAGSVQAPSRVETAARDHALPARMPIPWPVPSVSYHVYEVPVPGAPAGTPVREGTVPPLPARLTATPVKTTTYDDARVEYGTKRCYVVRTVETLGALTVESDASPAACVEPKDVFAPAAPKSLAAVASEGAISLIWEANTEADLAGYVVLRGIAPGAPAERLTPQPIRETTFRDTTVKPGTRYVYVVLAIDTATPPNQSAPSNPVEETAR